jgi:L-threonylcarbamoyladenylate synthase
MLPIHYAPRTPAWRAESADQLGRFAWPESAAVLVLGTGRLPEFPTTVAVRRIEDPRSAERELYRVLHEFDTLGAQAIVVVMPPDEAGWTAVRDRLLRATRPLPA